MLDICNVPKIGQPGRSMLNLPPPKKEVFEESDELKSKHTADSECKQTADKESEEKEPTPQKKTLKRRNASIYANNDNSE